MPIETVPHQSILVAVAVGSGNDLSDPMIVGVLGAKAAEEITEGGRFANDHMFADQSALPHKPGLYVWEGSITISDRECDDNDDNIVTSRWSGAWWPATAADLPRFGLRALIEMERCVVAGDGRGPAEVRTEGTGMTGEPVVRFRCGCSVAFWGGLKRHVSRVEHCERHLGCPDRMFRIAVMARLARRRLEAVQGGAATPIRGPPGSERPGRILRGGFGHS